MTTLTLTPVKAATALYPGAATFPGATTYPGRGILLTAATAGTLTLTAA